MIKIQNIFFFFEFDRRPWQTTVVYIHSTYIKQYLHTSFLSRKIILLFHEGYLAPHYYPGTLHLLQEKRKVLVLTLNIKIEN